MPVLGGIRRGRRHRVASVLADEFEMADDVASVVLERRSA